jgi:hypothetical protein
MRRLTLKVLAFLRWPLVALTAIVLGLTLTSSYRRVWCSAPLWDKTVGGLVFFEGNVRAHVTFAPYGGLGAAETEWILWADRPFADRPVLDGWWRWGYTNSTSGLLQGPDLWLPAWCVFASLGALSALGFRAKRRLIVPKGACRNCRHPLAGAVVCPECGVAP